jgi:hypothetical protein
MFCTMPVISEKMLQWRISNMQVLEPSSTDGRAHTADPVQNRMPIRPSAFSPIEAVLDMDLAAGLCSR